MPTALAIAALVLKLAPEIRTAVVSMIKALRSDDPVAARAALESALRLQFVARNSVKKP